MEVEGRERGRGGWIRRGIGRGREGVGERYGEGEG